MPAMERGKHLPFLCWAPHISLARHPNPLECARHSGQNPGLRICISASVSPQNPAQGQRESALPDPPCRTMKTQGLLIFQSWDRQHVGDSFMRHGDCWRPWGTAAKQQRAGSHGGDWAGNAGVGRPPEAVSSTTQHLRLPAAGYRETSTDGWVTSCSASSTKKENLLELSVDWSWKKKGRRQQQWSNQSTSFPFTQLNTIRLAGCQPVFSAAG